MKLSSKKCSLIHFLETNWHLNEMDEHYPCSFPDTLIYKGKSGWLRVLLFEKTKPFAPNQAQISELIRTFPNCVFIFNNSIHDLIDIYAKSALDSSPVIVHDLDWKNSAEFESLAKSDSFIEFTFELERQFGKKRIERRFVSDFKKYTQILANSWTGLIHDSSEIRYQLALNTLIRLFFVSFLEARNTLDQRKSFLQEEALKCDLEHVSIYRTLIQPLFFETLNRSTSHRTQRAKALGNIPFLNGGLFTPNDTEKNTPQLNAPNGLFLEIITELFEKYALSSAHTSSNLTPVLDPMMLGHVFESLMTHGKRAMTGSYYTPMPLARQLVLTTLSQWLEQNCALEPEQIRLMCIEHDFSGITKSKAIEIDNQLSEITILDPSVGSGAFLQCAFSLIHQIRSGLKFRAGTAFHPGTLARHILARNLYGVDIIPTASQLCELRLWLELIHYFDIDEQLPPLPNLDMNIRCGNTLTDLSQYARILDIKPDICIPSSELNHLKHRYKLATGFTKKKIAQKIDSKFQETGRNLLEAFIKACDSECYFIETPSPTLFETSHSLSAQQRQKLNFLKSHRAKLQSYIDNDITPGFSFDIHFSDIAEQGGFDIVLGNPPWYSLHTLPDETQKVLKTLYQTAVPVKGKKSQSADISALFVEKSLQCVRNNGLVAMLIPNKLFHAPSYENFRRHIAEHTDILHYHDWSNESFNAFEATTYPVSVLLKKTAEHHHPDYNSDYFEASSIAQTFPASPLDNIPVSLGQYYPVKLGIKTSANDVFIAPKPKKVGEKTSEMKFPASKDSVPIENELIHPVLKGAGISPYHAEITESILFTHSSQEPAVPLQNLPDNARNWIASQSQKLSRRKGIGKRPVYTVFGASNQLKSMKVVWKDISYQLEACFIKDPDILPLNTTYYIPVSSETEGYLLTAYLNSSLVREYCRARAEHANNDYRRYFAWLLEKLPFFLTSVPPSMQDNIEKITALSRACHCADEQTIRINQQKIDTLFKRCLEHYTQFPPKLHAGSRQLRLMIPQKPARSV